MRIHKFTITLALLFIAAALYAVFYFKLFSPTSDQDRTVSVILKSSNVRSNFWQMVSAGAAAAAKESGVHIDIQGPVRETDADTQLKLLEEALSEKPYAIVVAPINDPRIADILERIRTSSSKLVVMDMPIGLKKQPISVLNNHLEAGQLAGGTAVDLVHGPPRVSIISDYASSDVSAEREKGVVASLEPINNAYEGTYYCEDSEDKAFQIVEALLEAPKKPNAIVALNEAAALGSARAIKQMNFEGKIKLVAFDSSIYEIKILEEGILNAIVVQKPFNMGYLGVKAALRTDSTSQPLVTYTDSVVVNLKNMYTPENQKLIFPFDGK